jgi:dipeptidase E
MQLHLYSPSDPEDDLAWAVESSRAVLRGKEGARIAYLPLGVLYGARLLGTAEKAFTGLAQVEAVNTETMEPAQMERILRQAALAYIPSGNAFLLSHRLHSSRLLEYLRQKVRNGLPLIGTGAGAVICGPNILTSNDLNLVPTPHFEGLGATPFSLNVGYVDDARRDNWLADYRAFHDNPIIMLEDGGHLKMEGKKTTLVKGRGWCWRAGMEREQLAPGEPISPN